MFPFSDPTDSTHFNFKGRIPRAHYAWAQLTLFATSFVYFLLVVLLIVTAARNSIWALLLVGLVSLAFVFVSTHFSLSQGAKRAHDLGHSGWIQLVTLIPLVGWVFWFYLLFAPGQEQANQYGEPPSI